MRVSTARLPVVERALVSFKRHHPAGDGDMLLVHYAPEAVVDDGAELWEVKVGRAELWEGKVGAGRYYPLEVGNWQLPKKGWTPPCW